MIFFDQNQGIYKSTLIPIDHGFGTKQFGDGRYKQSLIKQTHSTNIHLLTSQNNENINNCDGIITKEKDKTLSVITADCVPIIFFDSVSRVVGISHQGWKGTLNKMPQKMVKEMISVGALIEHITVAIGPAINECCYEVNKDRYDQFRTEFNSNVINFHNRKYFINLLRANYDQLVSSGIHSKKIDYFPFCTSCNNEQFWSFRRDNGLMGEMFSYIKS